MNGSTNKSFNGQLESSKKYNEEKTSNDDEKKKKLSIQIFSKTSNDAKEERYTIDSDKPLTKKEITQIVIEKTGNNHNISEIKVKYNNSNDGDILIKFDNNKSSIESNSSINEKAQSNNKTIDKYDKKDKNSKYDKYSQNDSILNDEIKYTSRTFKSSLENLTEIQKEKSKNDKNNLDLNKFITKENGVNKEKNKKNKKSKLKFLDDSSPLKTHKINTNKKYKSQNSNATALPYQNGGTDDRTNLRIDNFGNIIAKNSNHKVCFADSLRKKLVEVVEVQSHKDYIANMNKQDFGKKDSVKCKCCCIVF
jgi:hypothetical protein